MATNRAAMAKQMTKPAMPAKGKKSVKMPMGMKNGGKVC